MAMIPFLIAYSALVNFARVPEPVAEYNPRRMPGRFGSRYGSTRDLMENALKNFGDKKVRQTTINAQLLSKGDFNIKYFPARGVVILTDDEFYFESLYEERVKIDLICINEIELKNYNSNIFSGKLVFKFKHGNENIIKSHTLSLAIENAAQWLAAINESLELKSREI